MKYGDVPMKSLIAALFAFVLLPQVLQSADDAVQPGAGNPLVRVVTLSQDGLNEKPGRAMLQATLSRMDQAASFQPDIVCLPEAFTRGDPEPVPGPTTEEIAAWARKHRSYVICPLKVRSDGAVTNSAVLIDRGGAVVGRYDKIRPTEGELKQSVQPGALDPPVFQTDFGAIGIQICFDVNWPNQWRRLREQGARIIFFPAAYPAARQLRSLAWENQCFVVSSTRDRPASILDVSGETLATTGKYRQWAAAKLPTGKRLFEIDFHVGKLREIERKYGDKVRVEWFHNDDLATLSSLDPQLTVEDLIAEFQLTPHADYIRRAQQAQDELRPAAGAGDSRRDQ
jgi:predicted amidohydrolase